MRVRGRNESHRHGSDLSDDFGFARIGELPNRAGRKRMGNKGNLRAAYFAPRTRVAFPQFNEKNWPVKFSAPIRGRHTRSVAVNLHEGARAKERVHTEILHPNVAILAMADIEFLNQRDGNFSPHFDHSGDEACLVEAETSVESNGEGDRLFGIRGFERSQVSIGGGQGQLITGAGIQVYAKNTEQVVEFHAVNHAHAEEFVDAGDRTGVFKLSEPGVGDVILLVLAVL